MNKTSAKQKFSQILGAFEHEGTDKFDFGEYIPLLYNVNNYYINTHRNLI